MSARERLSKIYHSRLLERSSETTRPASLESANSPVFFLISPGAGLEIAPVGGEAAARSEARSGQLDGVLN